ncbi:polyphosphate kinase 1 [Companilactobacillus sp.]|jgi:polyphosphate kinase|uniref:polyphosphate kinase 1 n=1 Tax=Companilactobacillus sp. TaxID=2767905 RepID=UPI0025C0A4C7|nr:polyphosphate kinase 1 [Companilactobacillus sp.]MCH4008543.1 polyphosphate kinase 1 [Companilactobacillus sp.]MCH4051278.1 polyphosphate kinase 1 [Companilactobacillus sp.]MCH4076486.1 polyphosphate kinase 1 [Companilactobacillus sp.]MCH4125061.1 polyphosphate kinase 1 [Companilactobacillus sp.]MCH4131602.1 polyphosphate kinase 1 [Companilactobacillus sp.]
MKSKYYNRDLSWLLFDNRVIDQAYNPNVPVLEKLRFLAIASNNLDEFFKVRMHNIHSMIGSPKIEKRTGLTGSEVLDLVHEFNRRNLTKQYEAYSLLMEKCRDKGIFQLLKYDELNDFEKQHIQDYYQNELADELLVENFSNEHRFRHNLNILMQSQGHTYTFPIPDEFDRIVPTGVDDHYILIEDVILNCADEIYHKYDALKCYVFRVTYDKNKKYDFLDEKLTDDEYLKKMTQYLNSRDPRKITRVEFWCDGPRGRSYFSQLFQISKKSVYKIPGPVDLKLLDGFFKLYKHRSNLVFPKFNARKWKDSKNILHYLDKTPMLLEYPYDSFSVFLTYLETAVNDPRTTDICITIYRTEKNSQLVKLLQKAAAKGIKVTALVELRARFDEEHNLLVSEVLKSSGVKVIYGDRVNKVHSKVCLVLQGAKDQGYVQIGTGNYNAVTSNVFSDISYFTSNKTYVNDAAKFFERLTDRKKVDYDLFVTSPKNLKAMIIENIKRATKEYLRVGKGGVFLKVNGLTDIDIINAIYRAARLGLPFRLIVRGPCSLKLGLCGEKEDIVVKSIVGELLEHSRIFRFQYGDSDEQIWISSADMMTRNLERRVEVAVPVVEDGPKRKLNKIVNMYIRDTENSYFLNTNGEYFKKRKTFGISAQQTWLKRLKWRKYVK